MNVKSIISNNMFRQNALDMQYSFRSVVSLKVTLFFLLLLSVGLTETRASHIVGGSMNYSCLGGDEYEITLTIYRDCFFGDPDAFFDDPAHIGIFDRNNLLVRQLEVPLLENDTLTAILSDSCLFVPETVCVHTTTYRDTITLLPASGGYQIVYQRCCRNQTVLNIANPAETGATYSVSISEMALQECNSNAKFTDWPPIFICVNQPIFWDHSAIDVDGDSLVYSLCTPLNGGSFDDPQPIPPTAPPYDTITWVSPTYSLENLLGGEPLHINPETGVLTGRPITMGQFVVGICVEEYRDGVLLSTTRRDFQYNVGECGEVIASAVAPEVQCDDLSVDLFSESQNADEFLWIFGDINNPDTILTEEDVSYIFPDTGIYIISLVVEPNSACVDTFRHEVFLQSNSLEVDFNNQVLNCRDSAIIATVDLSVDAVSPPVDWLWELVIQEDTMISTEQNPSFAVGAPNVADLYLTVTSQNGCVSTTSQQIQTDLNDPGAGIVDTFIMCAPQEIMLNPNPNIVDGLVYEWAASPDISDIFDPSPVVLPSITTTYILMITDTMNNCRVEKSIYVNISDLEIEILTDSEIVTCESQATLMASSNGDIVWEDSNGNVLGDGNELTVPVSGVNTYFASVTSEHGCMERDSVTVSGGEVEIMLNTTSFSVCSGDPLEVLIQNLDPMDTLTYNWLPDDIILSGNDSPNPVLDNSQFVQTTLYVETSSQFGCSRLDSVSVLVVNSDFSLDFERDLVSCDGLSYDFTNTSQNASNYVWDFGDPTNPNSTSTMVNPSYIYPDTGTYTVMLTMDYDVDCIDTLFREIRVETPVLEAGFQWEVSECTVNSATINFFDASVNNLNNTTDWAWVFGGTLTDNSQNPTITLTEDQLLEAELTITTELGCTHTITREIPVNIMDDFQLPDSATVCLGGFTVLNEGGNPDYIYQWTPEEGLSDPTEVSPLVTPTQTTIYSLTAADTIGGCEVEDEILVFVPPSIELDVTDDFDTCDPQVVLEANTTMDVVSIEWFDEQMNLIGTGNIYADAPMGATTYFVRATDMFGCVEDESVTVGAFALDVSLDDFMLTCEGEVQVSVNNMDPEDELTYYWYPEEGVISGAEGPDPILFADDSLSLVYYVDIENQHGCSLTDSIVISNAFSISLEDSISTCEDIPVGVTASSADAIIYSWSTDPDFTNIIGDSAYIELHPENQQTYYVVAENASGCMGLDSIVVSNNSIEVSLDNTQNMCLDDTTQLSVVNLDPIDELEYSWMPLETIIEGADGPNPLVNPTESTVYDAIITNQFGCEIMVSTGVNVIDLDLILSISADPDTIRRGESSQLNITADPDFTYTWAPPDFLDDNTVSNPVATLEETAVFSVVVVDENGCIGKRTVEVFVFNPDCEEPFIFVPNAFTPNGDGENDMLFVRATNIEEMVFMVYNRWGQKVFETNSVDIGWDGMFNGKELSPDVFGYHLKAKCYNGMEFVKNGNITLLK